ncbi:MAG: ABC transporter permease [Thermoanaerobaculia bacterium]|nr:ABC transporter permease [Thermoanaerobaculia bacterium]
MARGDTGSRSEGLYRTLLWLYPREFRAEASSELRCLFRDAYRDAFSTRRVGGRRSPWSTRVGFWPKILLDLVSSALAEHRQRLWPHQPSRNYASPPPDREKGTRMDTLLQDLRSAVRSLRATPSLTIVVALTLALGIGANTALFSIVHEILLRPLAISEPQRVVAIFTSDFSSGPFGATSAPDFRDFRDQSRSLEGVTAFRSGVPLILGGSERPQSLSGAVVSAEYFSVLGVEAHRGRLLAPSDGDAGAPVRVVLNHGLWQDRFGADDAVIGTSIVLNDRPVTVIGVASPDFRGTSLAPAPDAWLTLRQIAWLMPGRGEGLLENRGARWLSVAGRLVPGFDRQQAQVEMTAIMARLAAEYPDTNLGTLEQPDAPRPIRVVAAAEAALGAGSRSSAEQRAKLLMGTVGLVLLTACANVANLLMTQGKRRQGELAMRLSLGASRGRLIRQLLTESLLLSLLGGVIGVGVAIVLGRLLIPWGLADAISSTAVVESTAVHLPVLLFALGASVATGLLFGLLPAV